MKINALHSVSFILLSPVASLKSNWQLMHSFQFLESKSLIQLHWCLPCLYAALPGDRRILVFISPDTTSLSNIQISDDNLQNC